MAGFITRATLRMRIADVTEAIDLYYESMHTRCCSTLELFCFSQWRGYRTSEEHTRDACWNAVRSFVTLQSAGRVLLIEFPHFRTIHDRG
jgi:hypothetical protein